MKTFIPSRWPRIILLIILGYEALGAIVGGTFLIAGKDGRLMKMPVSLMRGTFPDFLIPGIILFGMGLLTAYAFIVTFFKRKNDWLIAMVALCGWVIWFVTEIIILQELHWLHIMWGLPVLLGIIVAIPLLVVRNDSPSFRRALLYCGIASTLWYTVINVLVPFFYDGYNVSSYTVSELSAIGAPTRILWVLLVLIYPLLFAAFGWAVLYTANNKRSLRIMGGLIIGYTILNLYWPPMHTRAAIAAGEKSISDLLHIIWAMVTVLIFTLIMILGAIAYGKSFRLYTIISIVLMMSFGILTSLQTGAMEADLPTPMMGTYERISIGIFLLWVIVFALLLIKQSKVSTDHLLSNAGIQRTEKGILS